MNEEYDGGEIAVVENTTAPTSIANKFDIVDVDAAEAFMDNYQELVDRLLKESDYQEIGDKKAKKKSAWRKLATAFNISDEIIHEEETRDETSQIVSAKYYVRATLPNGRSAVGVGVCSIYDKIRYHGKKRDKERPSNFELRGRFSNAEHDVPSTAHTRAKSRAIADLIGSGENSAEEFGDIPKDESSSSDNKKSRKRRRVTPKEEIIETKAEEVKDETPVVEAELVTDEPVEAELVTEEKPKETKKKQKTIKQLKDEYAGINTAIENLQKNKKKVSRERLVEELMKMYEDEKITLDEYRACKKELTG